MARVASSVGLKRVKERERKGDEKEKAQMSDESKLFRQANNAAFVGARGFHSTTLPSKDSLSLGGLMAALIRRLMDLTMS